MGFWDFFRKRKSEDELIEENLEVSTSLDTEDITNFISIFDTPKSKTELGSLGEAFSREIEVIAHTLFGDLFIRDIASSQIALTYIDPLEVIPLDANNFEDLINLFNKNPEAKNELFEPGKVVQLTEKLGTLAEEEIYIPYPHPKWGGDKSIDSYKKGKIWTYIELITQN